MSSLRHAVIGCGTVANYGHLPAVADVEDLDLVAICDENEQRRASAGQQYGVPAFADAEEMLRTVLIDSVTIATTVPTHGPLALVVAAAGKHCLCEKPLAADSATCRAMVDAFGAAGRILAVNFEFRFGAIEKHIKASVDSGRLGRLQSLRYVHNWDNHWHRPTARPRRVAFLNEGFGSMDCGVHALDQARWLTGAEFERLTAEGQWVEPEFSYPGHIHILGRMTDGTIVSIEESFAYTLNAKDAMSVWEYDIVGDRGVIHVNRPVDENVTRMRCHFEDETTVDDFPGFRKDFPAIYHEFARIVRQKSTTGSPIATGEDGARVIELVEQVIDACRRKRPPDR